jgi:predicted nucleotidyltransferase
MGQVFEDRKRFSDERFEQLRNELQESLDICGDKACIYATGSFGRREASEFSDFDLFIVSRGDNPGDRNWLTNLDSILLKADLIRATRKLGLPKFSRDGEFLQHHTVKDLIATTGTEADDATNRFTARLLLLLESRPLVGEVAHGKVIDEVIAKYWREFPDHADQFMPAYLANDVLRYWRTLCLNYEARTSEKTPSDRAKRKLANYKLKHSRMLTCFSALLFLLDVYVNQKTVTISDSRDMVSKSPTARVEQVMNGSTNVELIRITRELLDLYGKFLITTNASEWDLIQLFSNDLKRKELRSEQSRFGDLVYESLKSIGDGNRFYRRLVV